MSSIGKATLDLQIGNFEFSHTIIICHRLPEAEFLFSIALQKLYSLSYSLDSDRSLFMQRGDLFLTYTRSREGLHNIAKLKFTLKTLPRHNGTVPVRIKEDDLKSQVAYFISNQHIRNGLNPKIHVLGSIYDIKGKLTLYIMVANYTINMSPPIMDNA